MISMGLGELRRAAVLLAAFALVAKLTLAPALLQAGPVPYGKALIPICGGGQVTYVLIDLVGDDDPVAVDDPGGPDVVEVSECPLAASKLDFLPPQMAGLVTLPEPERSAVLPSSVRLSNGGPRGPPPARGPPNLT